MSDLDCAIGELDFNIESYWGAQKVMDALKTYRVRGNIPVQFGT